MALRHSSQVLRLLRRNFSLSTAADSKVAVVFSGCGVYDGSEVHEASAGSTAAHSQSTASSRILVHLSRQRATVGMFAPDVAQMHVVDHCKGKPVPGESRNALVESARIARGNISPLSSLSSSGYDAVVFPGGFGAAKNLSTFAVDGTEMKVDEDVQRVIKEFHQAGKPIGLCCISPVLGAKLLPGVRLTVGSDSDPTAQALGAMGAQHVAKSVTEALVDDQNKVVSTPAFMCDAPLHLVFDGIGSMITAVITLLK